MTIQLGTRLGPYEVLSAIGAGGMGEVYKARDTRLNRDIALKVLPEILARDQQRMARFEREAKLLASLNHTNIAAIYGLEESDGLRALVMELVEGPTLADSIKSGPIPVEEALAKQIAEAVEYAHEQNVIHRDLKPANIKVKSDGTVKVLDFGLAKAMSEDVNENDMSNSPTLSMAATRQGVILGTAAYMSPEQARGKKVDKRTDIWAFGAVLYEMLTGKQAFHGEDVTDVLAAVVRGEPEWATLPQATPNTIRNLLKRCLTKDLKRRLRDAGEARIAIEDILSGASTAEPVATAVVPRPKRPLIWIGVSSVLLLALAVLSFLYLYLREAAPAPLPSVRFDIAPPEKTEISMFKVSPDGRYVALIAVQEGKNRLWLRTLNSAEAKVVPGTDDAQYPFWSPDSSYIGFFAQGKLKKTSLNGGPAQTICDAPGGRGATWNRDGVIVFAPKISGGLFRVPATGGVPVEVTKLTTQGANDTQRFPEFISGGNSFTFFYQTEQAEITGVYIGFLDGKRPVRILPGLTNAVYVAPAMKGQMGYLLFRRESTLMAQPFDTSLYKLTGEAMPLAEPVGVSVTAGNGAFSASENGLLAYRGGTGTITGIRELVWEDREGRRISAIAKPAVVTSAALSPDEKTVAFSTFETNAESYIWLQDIGRGVASRFTFEPRIDEASVWSPDGKYVAFSFRPGVGIFNIAEKPLSGGKQEVLWQARLNAYPWDWSPDGKFIVYSDTGETTNFDLWLLPVAGDHKPVPLLQSQFNETQAQFSPDGRWIAYVSDESGKAEVYVQPFPATGGKWQISTSGGNHPRWRKDGKELYYIGGDGKLTAVSVKTGGSSSSSFEAGAPQGLFPVELLQGGTIIISRYPYQPSADGKRFLVNVPASGEGAGQPITMTLNWQAELKK